MPRAVTRALASFGAAVLLCAAAPAAAFGVICCNVTIDTPSANWVGYSRGCQEAGSEAA